MPKAFGILKAVLIDSLVLKFSDYNLSVIVDADGSDNILGAVS